MIVQLVGGWPGVLMCNSHNKGLGWNNNSIFAVGMYVHIAIIHLY